MFALGFYLFEPCFHGFGSKNRNKFYRFFCLPSSACYAAYMCALALSVSGCAVMYGFVAFGACWVFYHCFLSPLMNAKMYPDTPRNSKAGKSSTIMIFGMCRIRCCLHLLGGLFRRGSRLYRLFALGHILVCMGAFVRSRRMIYLTGFFASRSRSRSFAAYSN